jgi:hypothetical protein
MGKRRSGPPISGEKVAWDDHRFQPAAVTENVAKLIRSNGPWTWWVTLTFRHPLSQRRAMSAFRNFAALVAGFTREHINLAWVLDDNGGHIHFHTLLGFPAGAHVMTAKGVENTWAAVDRRLCGFVHIREYDENRGAAEYMAKKTDRHEYGLEIVCPRRPQCRRGKGCIRSPQAWT